MFENKLQLLALLLCFGQRVFSADIELTLQPENLILLPENASVGDRLSVTCRLYNLAKNDAVTIIAVSRNISSDVQTNAIATWMVFNNITTPNGNIPAMNVTSSSSDTSKTLVVTMGKTKCADASMYLCNANMVEGPAAVTLSASKALRVEVSPGTITLTPDPSHTEWMDGDTLKLICNGAVGTMIPGVTQVQWVWQHRESGGQWMDYTNTSDIKNGSAVKGECYERMTSTLTRVLAVSDSGSEIRCFIRRNSVDYTQFAASFAVGTVHPEGFSTTPPTNAGGSGDSDGANKGQVGGIVGGVIGAFVVIVVIVIIVVVLVRRRSKKGETYAAEEPRAKPADNSEARTGPYGQPSRFPNSRREPQGISNKAMEEPSPTQPYKIQRSNDYHQGRRNNAYDYDKEPRPRTQRRPSEEDGTDSRVNTSQLSIGHGDPSIGTAI